MTIALTMPPADWMANKNLRRIFELLGRDNARLVGGSVRNYLLNLPVYDFDISTKIMPENVTKILTDAGIKVVPTGIRFGTVTAVMDGQPYEITTLRRDVDTDGRRADVVYTDDWAEDAARRDFTMNALYADCDGHVYDPLGGGVDDLRAGIVRFIGQPHDRIAEDHLRILRCFRFMARYGGGQIDVASYAACHDMRDKIYALSAERITDEMYKILSDDSAPGAVAAMARAGILSGEGITEDKKDIIRRVIALQSKYQLPDNDARFYVLFENNKSKLFNFSNNIKLFFNNLDKMFGDEISNADLMLYRYGRRVAVQGAVIHTAREGHENYTFIENAISRDIPVFPVKALDVMQAFDIPQGREVGKIVRQIESVWIQNGLKGDVSFLINQVKENI